MRMSNVVGFSSTSLYNMFVVLLVLTATTTTIRYSHGFSSVQSPVQLQRTTAGSSTTTSLWATLEKETRMTSEDEAILFGDFDEEMAAATTTSRGGSTNGGVQQQRKQSPQPSPDYSKNPLAKKLAYMRDELSSCPDLWYQMSNYCPDLSALYDDHLCEDEKVDWTYSQVKTKMQQMSYGLQNLGIKKSDKVAIFAENSARWLLCDMGVQLLGGITAVRGADAPIDELRYIYEHSDSAGVVVLQGPKLLKRLINTADDNSESPLGLSNESHGPVKHIVLMNREKMTNDDFKQMESDLGIQIHIMSNWLQPISPTLNEKERPKLTRNDLATIVYTSGTTGHPKGVMLSHGNLLHQTQLRFSVTKPLEECEAIPGDCTVSLLPVWHITERTFSLWALSHGCQVVYSSIRHFKNDLAKHQPHWLVLVPRVLEKIATGVTDKFSSGSVAVKALAKLFTTTGNIASVHRKKFNGLVASDTAPNSFERITSLAKVATLAPINTIGNALVWKKVQDGFGGRVRSIICGGSALAGSLDEFFETAGIQISVGYGLTECSPLLSYRRTTGNLISGGCAGTACPQTEIRIVDPEITTTSGGGPRPALPDGMVGLVLGKGPQVMKGYYKNPEATAKAIDAYGWFDTGDLGRINPATGDLILTGRAKDTIVLSNGENIEPQPLEDAILGQSEFIDQVMCTGQDGRRLIAVVVLNPTELGNAGILNDSTMEWSVKQLQEDHDLVNNPKAAAEDCIEAQSRLQKAADVLRQDAELNKRLVNDLRKATGKPFRKWEQVSKCYLTLEPFAMVNGQLTQSYKVKRPAVLARYEDELPK